MLYIVAHNNGMGSHFGWSDNVTEDELEEMKKDDRFVIYEIHEQK